MIDHKDVLRIEKIVQRTADPNEGTRIAAAESLYEALKRHDVHASALSVNIHGGPDPFVLLNDLKGIINRQQNEIQFLRLHSDPAVLRDAIKGEKIDYRWPEFEELVRSRITGDDPEATDLSPGWRRKTVNVLGVSAGTLEKWKEGTAQIPERVLEQLREQQPLPVSESPVKFSKYRKTQRGRLRFSELRTEAEEQGYVLMKKEEAQRPIEPAEKKDNSPKHKMDFFKHTEIRAVKFGDYNATKTSWSKVRKQIAYRLLRSGNSLEELRQQIFTNGCWHFYDTEERDYLIPTEEDIKFGVKWTTRSSDEVAMQLEEAAKYSGQDICIHIRWLPEKGRAGSADGEHAGPAVFPNKEGIVWFTSETYFTFRFVLLSELKNRDRIIDSIFGSSSTSVQNWPTF